MPRVLVIDDDAGFRGSLLETLRGLGYETLEAASGAEGMAHLSRGGVDAVILDYLLGRELGTDVLREARATLAERLPPVLMLTAHADSRGTIEAMSLGAFDHLSKPIGREHLRAILSKAVSVAPEVERARGRERQFVGSSPVMREVHKLLGRAAASDAVVLVTGETGTGKEVAARAMHEFSARSAGPFVAVNCAAIPAELLEAELFGHSKGAFSGAVRERAGCFEQAHSGTLMLDEIGDMPLPMQAKILRVLQEKTVTRIGDSQERALDVRVIAATHRKLLDMVDAGSFRQDLYFRLNVLRVHMPALRDRREDIVPLAEFFLRQISARARVLSPRAQQKLENRGWPGNVRELRNAMERVSVMASGTVIEAEDLAFMDDMVESSASPHPDAPAGAMTSALASLEREMIVTALANARGNRSDAARRLGISRAQLYRKLRQFELV